MLHLLASLTWDPGIRGILVVVVAVVVLCGTPLILLITNVGSRLGFHIAITAIFGWLTLMFLFWAIYALGYKGPAPTWQVLDVSSNPTGAVHKQLHTVPQPDQVGDPVAYQKTNKLVAEAMKGRSALPTMGDVVAADPTVAQKLQPKLNGWRLLPTSDANNRDAAAATGEYLQANGFGGMQFQTPSSYVIGTVFDRGGKPLRKDGSMMQRVAHRIETTAMALVGDNPAHYAVVQVQPAIVQTSLPGEPPAQPVADPNQPVINVLLVRNLGAVRQPGIAFGILSGLIFLILAYGLHRRDKAGMAARRAAELAAMEA
jgi:hypothetical protein